MNACFALSKDTMRSTVKTNQLMNMDGVAGQMSLINLILNVFLIKGTVVTKLMGIPYFNIYHARTLMLNVEASKIFKLILQGQ